MHSLHHENYKSMTKNDKGSPHLETEGCKVHPEFPDLLYFIMHAGGVLMQRYDAVINNH